MTPRQIFAKNFVEGKEIGQLSSVTF